MTLVAHTAHDQTPDTSLLTDAQLRQNVQQLEADVTRLTAERDAAIATNTAALVEHVTPFAPGLLLSLLTSSAQLVTRFGGTLTEAGTLSKAEEEFEEFIHEITALTREADTPVSLRAKTPAMRRRDAACELIDTIVTLGGIAAYAGLTEDDIVSAAHTVLKKNAGKTEATHAWDDVTMTVKRHGH